MESSPRRSRSLTLDMPILLGSSYPPAINFFSNDRSGIIKDSLLSLGSKCIPPNPMFQSSSSDDSSVENHGNETGNKKMSNSISKKRIMQSMVGMFDSVKKLVRKLPNVVPNFDEELSVTVVSNGDVIPSKNLYVNVPFNSEESNELNSADMDLSMSMSINRDIDMNSSLDSSRKFQDHKTSPSYLPDIFTRPGKLSEKKFLSIDNIYRHTWTEHLNHAEESFEDISLELAIEESIKEMNNCQFCRKPIVDGEKSQSVTQCGESAEAEEAEEESMESDDDLVELSCPNGVPDNSQNTEVTHESLESSKSIVRKFTSVKCEFSSRTRNLSESSVESDCSFIVFEESHVELESCSSSGDEQDDDDNDSFDKFTKEFTSKSDYRSRRYSESSVDSDGSFIVFTDDLPSKCPDYDQFSLSEESDDDDPSSHKVRFNLKPLIHTMIKWNYAYRAARKGPWEEIARDRERFRGRINSISHIVNPILSANHRQSIWKGRFATQD
ncbi:uncharacterized protein LOC130676075 [Microplitis mediator]|uniref:uncharacterized protein LOC130676075 n=1 Tax=Microplitis mediator TaxID=375433 RepID=UPI002555B777|nr:uncharacterized protein LOC130676075 [Microplitis mediator]